MIVAESWPDKGNIEFKNVSLRYDALLDRVVRDVSFSIQGGHKVSVHLQTGVSYILFQMHRKLRKYSDTAVKPGVPTTTRTEIFLKCGHNVDLNELSCA